jgi:hypothetical protein
MISIVCVVNDRPVFESNLLASLKKQDTEFELVIVDNDKGQFDSIPKALNQGGLKTHREYILFAHQDVSLVGESWLKRAEAVCKPLGKGVFGVASVNSNGDYLGFIIDRGEFWGAPLREPVETFSLDECLILIPRGVFFDNKFDERFRFHSYGADLTLRLKKQGLDVYVIPCPIYHNSATTPILKAGSLEADDALLCKKHFTAYPNLRKTTGMPSKEAKQEEHGSFLKMKLLNSVFVPRFFNANARIQAEFSQKDPLLDLGAVPREQQWLKQAKSGSYSIGVSSRKEYLLASKRIHVHDDYVLSSLSNLPFVTGVFTTILLKGVLEYMGKTEGKMVLDNSLRIGGKKIVVVVPSKGSPSDVAYRYYASTWNAEELRQSGFETSGLHLRIDLRLKLIRVLPFLKPLLARLFPDLFARDLLCVKRLP